ncbi:MAG: LysR family transcriptional regulator [Rhodobiaceae bacterium]|nr:LysR family transcriptional regulator [Rhodobiaceae bacterium]
MNLRSVDLNLLTIFDAIMVEKHMTRAAARVGMTQPAMSNALARLRDLTGDPLFVRTGRGMTPTPRATALAVPVRRALELVQAGLTEKAAFDPTSSDRSFTLAIGDYCEVLFLPHVLAALEAEAPGVSLSLQSAAGATRQKELKDNSVDLVWDAAPLDGPGFRSEMLFDDTIVWIMSASHPLAGKKRPTLDDYASANHVRLDPGHTYVHNYDRFVRNLGIHRQFAVELTRIVPMAFIVAETHHVATVPNRMAKKFARFLPLAIKEVPLDLPGSPFYQSWHSSRDDDPALTWLRGRLVEMAKDF